VKDKADMSGLEYIQIVIQNLAHISPVVEGQIQQSYLNIFLAEVITEPESSHGDMNKIFTWVVNNEKFRLHIRLLSGLALSVVIITEIIESNLSAL
jgi:hypothetical protein